MEIDQDIAFSRTEWRVQRIGWVLIAVFVAAACLGLFGTGVLSTATAEGPGFRVRYARFERMASPTEIAVTVEAGAVREGTVHIWLSRQYASVLEETSAVPPPERVSADGERVIYAFRAKPNRELAVTIRARVAEGAVGAIPGRVGVLSAGETSFRQFAWP